VSIVNDEGSDRQSSDGRSAVTAAIMLASRPTGGRQNADQHTGETRHLSFESSAGRRSPCGQLRCSSCSYHFRL